MPDDDQCHVRREQRSDDGETFDSYDEFVPDHLPERGPFVAGHDVLEGRDHVAVHRLARERFEDLILPGLHLAGVAATMGAINFIATIFTERGEGVNWATLDIFSWTVLVQSGQILFRRKTSGATLPEQHHRNERSEWCHLGGRPTPFCGRWIGAEEII